MSDHSKCRTNCGATDCRVPWGQVLHDAARRSAKIIRPEPDCRTCKKASERMNGGFGCLVVGQCTNADRYEPMPPVRLWARKAAP